jgi:hypothetical protein
MGQAVQWIDRAERRVKLRYLHILLAVAQSGGMGRTRHLAACRVQVDPGPRRRARRPDRVTGLRPPENQALSFGIAVATKGRA